MDRGEAANEVAVNLAETRGVEPPEDFSRLISNQLPYQLGDVSRKWRRVEDLNSYALSRACFRNRCHASLAYPPEESVGFEPTEDFSPTVFKTAALSQTPPALQRKMFGRGARIRTRPFGFGDRHATTNTTPPLVRVRGIEPPMSEDVGFTARCHTIAAVRAEFFARQRHVHRLA